jgi:hypothetical protein
MVCLTVVLTVRGLLKNSVQEMGKKLKGERVEET